MPARPQPKSEDRVVDEGRKGLEALERRLRANPFFDGQRINSVELAAGADTRIGHALNRIPQGWIELRKRDAGGSIFEQSVSKTDLVLRASAAITLDLWVF